MSSAAVGQVIPAAFDVEQIRAQFPVLATLSRGKPIAYLDSAVTSQKPQVVIDAIAEFYGHENANVNRGVYELSERATLAWDAARAKVAAFLGGKSDEVIFARGTTEAINLVANSFVRPRIATSNVVLVTEMEHHANIVPWQLAGATTRAIPITDRGEIDLEAAGRMLADAPMLLAVVHVSNALGTINPIAELSRMAARHGVPVLVDGAQAVPHLPVDVRALGCDFYAFSSHKIFGPTGIGALWAKREHIATMPPYQGGGDMIDVVSFERTTFAKGPKKFEAGTPHIAGAIGLHAALDWFDALDLDAVSRHEHALAERAAEMLVANGARLIGTAPEKVGVVTFVIPGAHPHDVASILDGEGVCVRAGHHCTQPLHRRLGVPATVRASFAPYNTHADVDALERGIARVRNLFPA